MNKFGNFLRKALEIKVNAFILLFAGSVLVYAASNLSTTKDADGIWQFGTGNTISATQINQNFAAVKVPSGAIMAFNKDNCPSGWLLANGTNGTPNLQGVFIRGKDFGTGRDSVRAIGDYQADAFQGHNHEFTSNAAYYTFAYGLGSGGTLSFGSATSSVGQPITNATYGIVSFTNETRPKNVALLYCMKQ